jgi:hypothetical protein
MGYEGYWCIHHLSASFDYRYSCPVCERMTGLYGVEEPQQPAVEENPDVARRSGPASGPEALGFSGDDAEELRVWSGALPAIINAPARPWNGRALTERERLNARWVYVTEGPQAAYEWLSEHAR